MDDLGQKYTLPSRILVATDLTELKYILTSAINYAQRWKAVIKLMHVLPDIHMPDVDSYAQVRSDGETVRHATERVLEDAAEKARQTGVKCSWSVRNGKVAQEIIHTIQEWRADRLVIGSHGPRKFHQELLGSVAESILREVEIPTLVIGPAAAYGFKHTSKKSRILLATALDRESLRIAKSVVRFARTHQAELTMLYVTPEIAKAHPSAVRVHAYAEHRFQQVLSDVGADTPLPSCMIERGPVVETILRVAMQGNFDLILLGGVSGSSFRTDIMPGTAYGVTCGAPCPVMVLKENLHLSSSSMPAA